MVDGPDIVKDLQAAYGQAVLASYATRDGTATIWAAPQQAHEILQHLRHKVAQPYRMLYDLTAVDERNRRSPQQIKSDFTVVYHLMSLERNSDLRVKVPLSGPTPAVGTVTDIWPSADWYEREIFDMFGIDVTGHAWLRRILSPPWWEGHPLRKDYPARATEHAGLMPGRASMGVMEEELQVNPADWGLTTGDGDQFTILNLGPHHPGTHGVLRLVLQLRDEQIVNMVPDIGFHHRGAEKMGERQSWHTYIPYTDRVDYLGGVMNNLPYVLSVEAMAGITVPDRVKYIRVMMCELFRIISHLVWFGTFALDLGQMSPVFYMFTDREKAMEIVQAVTGGRMHPNYFRIGGVALDLPEGWEEMFRAFVNYFPRRLDEYQTLVLDNAILKARTVGVGKVTTDEAIEWGMTGPNLRATGLEWDFRRKRPYSGYEMFEFDIPTAAEGDCYARAVVRMAEMRQSLRIIEQCVHNMPGGDYKSRHALTTPPLRDSTMRDIETLITHFVGVSWGPVIPPGEAGVIIEGTKGAYSYHLDSDGDVVSYRTRIRTASFPHIQMLPLMTRGGVIADLIAVLGSIDFVLADVDR